MFIQYSRDKNMPHWQEQELQVAIGFGNSCDLAKRTTDPL